MLIKPIKSILLFNSHLKNQGQDDSFETLNELAITVFNYVRFVIKLYTARLTIKFKLQTSSSHIPSPLATKSANNNS